MPALDYDDSLAAMLKARDIIVCSPTVADDTLAVGEDTYQAAYEVETQAACRPHVCCVAPLPTPAF